MEQEISELTEKEKEWLALQLHVASAFVKTFSPRDAGHPVSLAALDRAFAAWMATQPTESDVINGTCPLYPRKQTLGGASGTSAKGQ